MPVKTRWTRTASRVYTISRSFAETKCSKIARIQADLDDAKTEIALLKEEISLKDERFSRVPAHERPFYRPIERMRILNLRAAQGWSSKRTAEIFLLNEQTIASWMQRLDEDGEKALIQLQEPVNKFPDFVRQMVLRLKLFYPGMGKHRIAELLARVGLHLGVSTVARMLKQESPVPDDKAPPAIAEPRTTRTVKAKSPNHVYHIDLTVIPTRAGFWVPWLPFAFLQLWPFCWWVAVVIDHFSRHIVGVAVFPKPPITSELQRFLRRIFRSTGHTPKYIISDKHPVFFCQAFKDWCSRLKIRPRFGAVGKHGSIALIERTILSLKNEYTRKIFVPLRLKDMQSELSFYASWYNGFRPHQALGGKTPKEVYLGLRPACEKPWYEPRSHWPGRSPCASPQAPIKRKPGVRLRLVICRLEGKNELPIIGLRRVA
jgi:transposase InsO family protein